jgi:hypothetical protein
MATALPAISFQSNGIKAGDYWYPVISHFPQPMRAEVERRANAYPRMLDALRAVADNRDGQIIHRATLERVVALLQEIDGGRS